MAATLEDMRKKKAGKQSGEELAAEEVVRRAREQACR